jgi:triosephosphate isomerase
MSKSTRKIIIAANWKMNQTRAKAAQFFRDLKKNHFIESNLKTVIFPQTLLINDCLKLRQSLGLEDCISIGIQNTYLEKTGAFTGENSPQLAREFGVEFALIGHSERRTLFGETNQTAKARAIAGLKAGLEIIFCVGETWTQKESKLTESTVFDQLAPFFEITNPDERSLWIQAITEQRFHIAYEPVWAIGTGRNPSAADANQVHQWIRRILIENASPKAQSLSILYGGSVKPENALGFMAMPEIDGLLVGGASLEMSQFLPLIEVGYKTRLALRS